MSGLRILLTGATGGLAGVLSPFLAARGEVLGVSRANRAGLARCDLTDAQAVAALVREARPDLVVHLAALTDVDGCEAEPLEAWRQNVQATRNLVDALAAHAPEARLVYSSTDQIYDAPGPSAEDAPQPKNTYSLTKLWAEDLALSRPGALICRVNFFGVDKAGGGGLLAWLERACAEGGATLFHDVWFNPLHVADLAEAMAGLIDVGAAGALNLGAHGDGLSKAAFLRAVAERRGLDTALLRDGSAADVTLRAYRPRDMRMDVRRAEAALGRALPTVAQGIERLTAAAERREAV